MPDQFEPQTEPTTSSAPPPPQAPEKPARGRGCATGCGFASVGLVSAILGGLLTSLLLPAMLGVDPITMLRGGYLAGTPALTQKLVTIVSSGTAEPIAAVAQKLTPSVVNISTRAVSFSPFGQQQVSGTGSGVIMSADGYIVTNDHVVGNATQIFVTVGSDANIPGKVVARDPESDIAVIKVDRKGLVPAEFGDSSAMKVGDSVVAIGSPFGLEHSVTSGIVSALNRNQQNATSRGSVIYTDLIQTDAAINPGNSGGALANLAGQVIGINTLIETPSGQFGAPQSAGIGFAIPSSFVRKVAEQLIKSGSAGHPYLGIVSGTLTAQEAEARKLPVKGGALIVDVPSTGPASRAGVKRGDVLVEISGRTIASVDDIFAAVRDHNVGDKVTLVVYRGAGRLQITVTLANKPPSLLPRG